MKKLILSGIAISFALPCLALAAAYNDVTLSTGTRITVNGIAVNVAGTTLLNQITTGATSFYVTLAPGSTIYVTAPGGNQLVPSGGSVSLVTTRCDSGGSSVTLTSMPGDATSTMTITPTAIICSGQSVVNGGAISVGGGGGGGYYAAPVIPITTPAKRTNAASLTSSQIQSILSLLSSFGADISTIANVRSALEGTASTTNSVSVDASPCSFTRSLKLGAKGADVSCLQNVLRASGFLSANASGYFGSATKAAVAAWQKSAGVSPASGYFGSVSRAHWTSTVPQAKR